MLLDWLLSVDALARRDRALVFERKREERVFYFSLSKPRLFATGKKLSVSVTAILQES